MTQTSIPQSNSPFEELTKLLKKRQIVRNEHSPQEVSRILLEEIIGRRKKLFGLFRGNSEFFTIDELTGKLEAEGINLTAQQVLFGLHLETMQPYDHELWYLCEYNQKDGTTVYQYKLQKS